MARWDTSELHALVADLAAAPKRMQTAAEKEMKLSATRLHKKMKLDAAGHRYLKSFAGTMAKENIGDLEWEIGFNKRGQGKLANIIVFGSVHNAPVYSFYRPFRTEQGALTRRLGEDAEDAVLGDA